LVIEFLRHFDRQLDGAVVIAERVTELAEQDRLRGDGHFDFFRVPTVVQADAYDLLRSGHERAELERVFPDEHGVGGPLRRDRVEQRAERGAVLVLQEVVQCRRRRQPQVCRRLLDVEKAALGLDPEPVLALAPHSEQREPAQWFSPIALHLVLLVAGKSNPAACRWGWVTESSCGRSRASSGPHVAKHLGLAAPPRSVRSPKPSSFPWALTTEAWRGSLCVGL